MRASFALDLKRPFRFELQMCVDNAMRSAGLIGEHDKVVNITDAGGNALSVGDIVRALGVDSDKWHDTFALDKPWMALRVQKNDGRVERFCFPLLPKPPQGSESPLFASHCFSTKDGWSDSLEVSLFGDMRDFEECETPYIDFFFNYLSALTNSGILYSHVSTCGKRQNKFAIIESGWDEGSEKEFERVISVLAFYFKTYTEWKAARKEKNHVKDDDFDPLDYNGPSWTEFFFKRLEEWKAVQLGLEVQESGTKESEE